jgi:hypothetical protein
VGLVADEGVMKQAFDQILWFYPVSMFSPIFHTRVIRVLLALYTPKLVNKQHRQT